MEEIIEVTVKRPRRRNPSIKFEPGLAEEMLDKRLRDLLGVEWESIINERVKKWEEREKKMQEETKILIEQNQARRIQ